MLGNGYGVDGCDSKGWAVRVVYTNTRVLSDEEETILLLLLGNLTCERGSAGGCDHVHLTQHGNDLGVNVLFSRSDESEAAANTAAAVFNAVLAQLEAQRRAQPPNQVDAAIGARVYAWNLETTSSYIGVPPSGMQLDSVHFEPGCAKTGCWVLQVVYTTGSSDATLETFNTFYLPYAVGSETLSHDYDYADHGVLNTFDPAHFPCRVTDYVTIDGSVASLPVQATACCFGTAFDFNNTELGGDGAGMGLLGKYRVSSAFADYATAVYPELCPGGHDVVGITASTPKPEERFPDGSAAGPRFHAKTFLAEGQRFQGMPQSPGDSKSRPLDAFIGQYKATIKLDDQELRTKAGLLKGSVGVEHIVDFFLGFASFKPAATTWILDSHASQAAVHIEKTSFFTVSTHGINDYTFLEYVNLRLVAVYNDNLDRLTTDEDTARTVRTTSSGAGQYVQVTFTLGGSYEINSNTGLIPVESVRAGKGSFFSEVEEARGMHSKCIEYLTVPANEFGNLSVISRFNRTLHQSCAPAALMCASPSSIPDSFVAFNIPLGVDFLGIGSDTLMNNVFVDFVISTEDQSAKKSASVPNNGEAPWQMKTTLSASIPIVPGGVNIFCDGITARTDLKDVANIDIIVGSAMDEAELSRLRIMEDAASTPLRARSAVNVDTDSIEAGLMTLVLKGNASYFANPGINNKLVSLELEDVVTIHLMDNRETLQGPGSQGKQQTVSALLEEGAGDTPAGLEGYKLNGAFYLTIDRSAQRAHLEPSERLLHACPFNPPRPADTGDVVLETCVTRRDVRYRDFPWRTGAMSTAMEVTHTANQVPLSRSSIEARFFTTLLGDSAYARALGTGFAGALDARYQLNGRYTRAFWVNPAYEWAPPQVGGRSMFQVSQKLFLFALVTLDVKIASDAGASIFDGTAQPPEEDSLGDGAPSANIPRVPPVRRRMLLSVVDPQADAVVSSAEIAFPVSRSSLLSSALDVAPERSAALRIELLMTKADACLSTAELHPRLRSALRKRLISAGSAVEKVQVVALSVHSADVHCTPQAARRAPALSAATAALDAVVVFGRGSAPTLDLDALSDLPGVHSVSVLSVPDTAAVWKTSTNTTPASEGAEGANTALISGFSGAAGAFVVAAGVCALMCRRRRLSGQIRAAALASADGSSGSASELLAQLKTELVYSDDRLQHSPVLSQDHEQVTDAIL